METDRGRDGTKITIVIHMGVVVCIYVYVCICNDIYVCVYIYMYINIGVCEIKGKDMR